MMNGGVAMNPETNSGNKEQSDSATNWYIFDFSNVDFSTGEGEWFEVDIVSGERIPSTSISFDSIEKTNAYLHAYDEAKDKFRVDHLGVYLEGDDDKEILEFSNICRDFDKIVSSIYRHLFDINCEVLLTAINGYLPKDFRQKKEEIPKILPELSLVKEKLNNSIIKLFELTESSRRDNKDCSWSVNFAIKNMNRNYQNTIILYKSAKDSGGGSDTLSKEIKEICELLYPYIMEFPEISQIINKCIKSLENLLGDHFPVLLDSFFEET
jgi:hypothetical protein